LRIAGLTQTLNEIHGPITFDTTGINVSGMRARFGESDVAFGGNITLDGMKLREYNLTARGQQMAVRYPPGLRSIVDANLYFRGPVDAPTLGGDVVVTQAEYRPVLPSNTGLIGLAAGGLGGGGGADTGAPGGESTVPVRLAIDIRAPRTRFINNESATVNGRANLQVVGTLDRPQLTGRVDIESGEVRLGATRLLVQPGTIDFVNNTPVFDVEAITRPRVAGQTYDIDVRLRGTLDKLTPTFSSDPYLPNMQIVAMVLGSVPSDEALRSAQLQSSTSQQDLQRSALTQAGVLVLTSPISATIGTAVKKTLPGLVDWVGVTPLLTNVTDQRQLNPGVRITLGKRISDKMFITYSRALNSQYEIILVEFEQSDRLSWVLSRNEDRSFALDFRVRHVF
jgi:hypothetical protein